MSSSSRCLKSAFDACRPSTTVRLQSRILLQRRGYADKSPPKNQNVPAPSKTPRKQPIATELPEKSPPKRSTPPAAEPAPAVVQSSAENTSKNSPAAQSASSTSDLPAEEGENNVRPIPANVLAAYRSPLKHTPPYGVPVASLQLRSYSVRSLEFFSDFALRAAYYLNLPASGPVPLPQRIERWTMPRSTFVHKKSQENFERITYKRLITIMDGEKSAVEVWLAVLRKWQFYGVGMKANVWEWEGMDVASRMDAQAKDLEQEINAKLANFGWNKNVAASKSLREMMQKQGVKHVAASMMDIREDSRSVTLGEAEAAKTK